MQDWTDMDEFTPAKGCWGVTLRAVAVFAGVLGIVTLVADDSERQASALDAPVALVATK